MSGLSPDLQLVTMSAGIVVPGLVGLVTSTKASEVIQLTIASVLSVIVGLVSTWAAYGAWNWITAGIAVMSVLTSTLIIGHLLWSKTGALQKVQTVSDGIAVDRLSTTLFQRLERRRRNS